MLEPGLLDFAVQSFVTLFVVMDPIGLAPIFIALTVGRGAAERRRVALRAVAIAAAVLTVFGLAGRSVIEAIGIGLPAFRISGGLMLFLIAVEMLFERRSEQRMRTAEESQGAPGAAEKTPPPPAPRADDPTVFPLATPLLAGPGAMAAMILLTAKADGSAELGAVYLSLAAVLALCLGFFLLAGPIERLLGPTGVKLVTRLLGVLLAALAVQFVLDGLADYGFVRAAERASVIF